ncbi:MAG: hypothetical protein AAFU79_16690 [Myxococcota bacterium]
MSNNWIWAGGFLVLAFGGIGFGARAGVESGREALRVEALHAKRAHAEHEETHAPVARAGAHPTDKEAKKPAEAHAAKAPVRLELVKNLPHAGKARRQVKIPRVEVKRPVRPARPDARLFTSASEIDVAFATGRIDRLPGRSAPAYAPAVARKAPLQAPEAPEPEAAPEAPLPVKAPEAPLPEKAPEAPEPEAAPEVPLPVKVPEAPLPAATPEAPLPAKAPKAPEPPQEEIEAQPEVHAAPTVEAPEPQPDAAAAPEATLDTVKAPEAAPSAEAPAPAPEAVETDIEAASPPDVDESTENPTPAAEPVETSSAEIPAVDGLEAWTDETESDAYVYQGYLVRSDTLDFAHARL